jgi:hypothetical protein
MPACLTRVRINAVRAKQYGGHLTSRGTSLTKVAKVWVASNRIDSSESLIRPSTGTTTNNTYGRISNCMVSTTAVKEQGRTLSAKARNEFKLGPTHPKPPPLPPAGDGGFSCRRAGGADHRARPSYPAAPCGDIPLPRLCQRRYG